MRLCRAGLAAAVAGCGGASDVAVDPPYWRFPPAAGLDVAWVAAYQGPEIPLLEHPDAPWAGLFPASLVEGKQARIRVGLDAAPDFDGREVAVVLEVTTPEGAGAIARVGEPERWDRDDVDTTFNFVLPPELVRDGMQVSVSVHEVEPFTLALDGRGRHRWTSPPLAAVPSDRLDLVFVPFAYQGAVPDTSPEALATYRAGLLAEYPVTDIEVSVAAQQVATANPATYAGQAAALDRVSEMRDDPAIVHQNTYFFGLLASHEPGDGILGLSFLPGPGDVALRASVGLAERADTTSLDTMKHELGHAHGRRHVDCQGEPGPLDADYPYPGGEVGSRHYDPLGRAVIADGHFDAMTYCAPAWVSDYTYQALLERVRAVRGIRGAPSRWLRAWSVDGATAVVGGHARVVAPSGEPVAVRLVGAGGVDLGAAEGYWIPHSHGPGGAVLVRTDRSDVVEVVLEEAR